MTSRNTARTLIASIFVAPLLVGACGTPSPAASTATVSDSPTEPPVSTTVITTTTHEVLATPIVPAEIIRYELTEMEYRSVVAGHVISITEDSVAIEIEDVLVDSGFTAETLILSGSWHDIEVGDAAVALVWNNDEYPTAAIYAEDPYALRVPLDPTEPSGYLGQQEVLDSLWDIPTRRSSCAFVPTGPETYETPVDVVMGYLGGATPSQQYRAWVDHENQLDTQARKIADGAPDGVDPVSGDGTWVDERAVRRQLAAGVANTDVEVSMLIPVFFDNRNLTDTTQVAIIDVASQWVLYVIDLHPGMSSGDWFFGVGLSGSPTPGAAVQLVTFEQGLLTGCYTDEQLVERLEAEGTVVMEIEYDDFAGTYRALIDVANGTAEPLDGAAIENLKAAGNNDR